MPSFRSGAILLERSNNRYLTNFGCLRVAFLQVKSNNGWPTVLKQNWLGFHSIPLPDLCSQQQRLIGIFLRGFPLWLPPLLLATFSGFCAHHLLHLAPLQQHTTTPCSRVQPFRLCWKNLRTSLRHGLFTYTNGLFTPAKILIERGSLGSSLV